MLRRDLHSVTVASVAAVAMLFAGSVFAEPMNKSEGNQKSNGPGTTGAMQNSTSNGVATDPGGVAAQQGDTAKKSAGTVGAAPGADTKSQKPDGK